MRKKTLIIIMLCFVLSNQQEERSFAWWMWTIIGFLWIVQDLIRHYTKTKQKEEE